MLKSIALVVAFVSQAAADTRYGLAPNGKVEVHNQRCAELRSLHALEKIVDRDPTITVGLSSMSITIGKTTVEADSISGDTAWWELDPEHNLAVCIRPSGAHSDQEIQIAVFEHTTQTMCFERWVGLIYRRPQ